MNKENVFGKEIQVYFARKESAYGTIRDTPSPEQSKKETKRYLSPEGASASEYPDSQDALSQPSSSQSNNEIPDCIIYQRSFSEPPIGLTYSAKKRRKKRHAPTRRDRRFNLQAQNLSPRSKFYGCISVAI